MKERSCCTTMMYGVSTSSSDALTALPNPPRVSSATTSLLAKYPSPLATRRRRFATYSAYRWAPSAVTLPARNLSLSPILHPSHMIIFLQLRSSGTWAKWSISLSNMAVDGLDLTGLVVITTVILPSMGRPEAPVAVAEPPAAVAAAAAAPVPQRRCRCRRWYHHTAHVAASATVTTPASLTSCWRWSIVAGHGNSVLSD